MVSLLFALIVGSSFLLITADSTEEPWIPDDGHLTASDIAAYTAESENADPPTDRLAFQAASLGDLPWNLKLVNRDYRLAEDFAPEALAEIPAGRWAKSSYYVDARIEEDVLSLLQAAEEAGCHPTVISAYRPYDYQQTLFANRVRRAETEEGLEGDEALERAAFWVALPGASEHQMGLALDIVDAGYSNLDEGQESTVTQQWLMEHCAEYGFILRYPTDKSAITGIGYEPWHYRYVGQRAAADIMASGLSFEEWLTQRLG